MLKLFNTLTRKKEIFKPARGRTARFYACGPTVYDYVHIGNLRTFIFDDILRRVLEIDGHKTKMVMNLTDVDDKTISGAKKAGKSLEKFTKFYEKEFFKDIKKLNILPASKYARATEHVAEMIELVQTLLKKKYAYSTKDGVYFDISKSKNYGRLSGLKKRELKPGARVKSDSYEKSEAEDFVLWKAKKPGEPFWPAPFGAGRPGWHLECSAMSVKYLGLPIDIHSGGVDLIFPHHENEIAQSESAFGKKFVRFFTEGEHLLAEGKKMSKSLGNLFTLKDLERRGFSPMDFRYLVLTAHYRSPLSFGWKSLEAARRARLKLEEKALEARGKKYKQSGAASFKKSFLARINDDLDTPRALALLWKQGVQYEAFLFSDRIFGLGLGKIRPLASPAAVQNLLETRERLRLDKKWRQADKIRDKIRKLGFLVEDTPEGPRLKKAT